MPQSVPVPPSTSRLDPESLQRSRKGQNVAAYVVQVSVLDGALLPALLCHKELLASQTGEYRPHSKSALVFPLAAEVPNASMLPTALKICAVMVSCLSNDHVI